RAHAAIVTYKKLYSAQPVDQKALENARAVLQLCSTFGDASAIQTLGEMLLLRSARPASVIEMEAAFSKLESRRAATMALQNRVQMQTPIDLTAALAVAVSKVNSFLKFLLPSWHKSCAIIQKALMQDWPDKAGAKVDMSLLTQLSQRINAAQGWQAAET